MSYHRVLVCVIVSLAVFVNAKPTDLLSAPTENDVIIYNPLSPDFKWTKFNIAVITTGGVVVAAGLAMLTTLFFPMFVYKLCYALGGCQNTMDNYVDRFLGVDGLTRKIKRRDLREVNDMDYIMSFLKMAMQEYGSKPNKRHERENIMKLTLDADHQIEKRSPIDYIEPILVMVSKAYNEYVDPQLKKNFKKPPSIR